MKKNRQQISSIFDTQCTVHNVNTVIVGSGTASLNCAIHLWEIGCRDIVIVTEKLGAGTSANTGSDKQTYYKLSAAARTADSPVHMAEDLMRGGAMHGDTALVESALSLQEFYHLVHLGVPFPHNRYGEFVGYKTDHDPRQRATSAGPLTSQMMFKSLLEEVRRLKIPVVDRHEVVSLIMSETRPKSVVGVICMDKTRLHYKNFGIVLFNAVNVVYGTGGPGAIYRNSVYPKNHTGSTGIALEAGANACNLTESQYGLASLKFRWNVSGSYQQVIPRYISTDSSGKDKREFLRPFFPDTGTLSTAIFLKGYQWPFDPAKVANHGSSLIDLLVYRETELLGRRVFMDFTANPTDFSLNKLSSEAHGYLKNSGATGRTPIQRLRKLNSQAIDLYRSHKIDITRAPLEIGVCAQHNNGGLAVNLWWESNIRHLFPIGEAAGTHGVYRPGGSALNSGQVGGLRAAQYICARYNTTPPEIQTFKRNCTRSLKTVILRCRTFLSGTPCHSLRQLKSEIQQRMSRFGSHIRRADQIQSAYQQAYRTWINIDDRIRINRPKDLPAAFKIRDICLTHLCFLSAIRKYIRDNGQSRGSYLVSQKDLDTLLRDPAKLRIPLERKFRNKTLETVRNADGSIRNSWKRTRSLPIESGWFEKVWKEYTQGKLF